MIRIIAAASLLSLAALCAQPASAAERVASQLSVNLNKVDFSKPDQAKFAMARLEAAAKRVCDSDVSDPATANEDRACEQQAVDQALAEARNPTLSQLAERSDYNDEDAGRYAVAGASH